MYAHRWSRRRLPKGRRPLPRKRASAQCTAAAESIRRRMARLGAGNDHLMDLPVAPPVAPMLAQLVRELPRGPGWTYEPKWDGFRALAFRDGDDVALQSRNERPLGRYFPEVVEALRGIDAERFVIDGELVVGE